MEVDDLPVSRCVGEAADAQTLALLIYDAMGGTDGIYFRASDRILKGMQSGRIFYCSSTGYGFPLPKAMSPMEIAKELVKFTPEARYPIVPEHRVGWDKGWQIHRADNSQGSFIIAWATWVPPR
jgi:hypothetical protein